MGKTFLYWVILRYLRNNKSIKLSIIIYKHLYFMVNPCNPPFPHPKKPPVSLLSVSKKKRGGEKKKVPLMGLTSRRFPSLSYSTGEDRGQKNLSVTFFRYRLFPLSYTPCGDGARSRRPIIQTATYSDPTALCHCSGGPQ